ncbi:MAG: ABC transporter permease [Acidobacteria bacterium]|nr:MAG: ABC transporter permease [Acidobacteriota bacterium]
MCPKEEPDVSRWFDNRLTDLRWASKAIRRSPGTSSVAVLSLALGIGANTAIFSLVNALLLKILPLPSPHELVLVASNPSNPRTSWNYPDYVAFRDRTKGFTGLAAASGVRQLGLQTGDSGAAELAPAQFVSGNYFDVLGVRPALGRLFDRAEDGPFGASPWAVLNHDFWKSRFSGDPSVIGRTIRVNGYPLSIVGVSGPGFRGADPTARPGIYIPMVMHSEITGVAAGVWNTRHYWWFQAVGRVPAGASRAAIETQLNTIFEDQQAAERRADPRQGQVNSRQPMTLVPAERGYTYARRTFQRPLLILMAVVGFVLLIACANVANIMLARGAARQREIALRMAVGAGRSRLALQFVTESVLISVAGGLGGMALAWVGVRLLLDRFLPASGPQRLTLDITPDVTMLAFTFAVSLLTGVLAGLAPALQATRPDLVPALKDEVPGRAASTRALLRRGLVVVQVALSLLLLVGAALFVRTLSNLREVDAGFSRTQTLIAEIEPSRNGYKGQRLREFYERWGERVRTLPGVRSVSLAAITPLSGSRWNGEAAVEGRAPQANEPSVDFNAVGPRYFETMGIRVLLGREFRQEDNPAVFAEPPERLSHEPEPEAPGPRVAIVSETFARRYLGGGSPVGRRISFTSKFEAARAYEVVGVVQDAHYFGLREGTEAMVYIPVWRTTMTGRDLCVRTSGAAPALVESIRKAVTGLDSAVPLISARTIEEQIDADIVQERLLATLAGLFGGLALLLACVGLYGVISYIVTRRTREIGIRLALGAERRGVLWMVMRDALILVGAGAAIGVPAALWLSRLIASLLYGVSPRDLPTLVAGVAMLAAVGALAVLVPARRALRIHPSEALRYE